MKLSNFYSNTKYDFTVKNIVTSISKIKKNSIFVNLQNDTNIDIPSSIKDHVLVITQVPLYDINIMSINVLNIYDELIRIYNIFYNLNNHHTKLIGVLNDDFLNYTKIINDLFSYGLKEKNATISTLDDIDQIYDLIGSYYKKKFKYIFIVFHSSEIGLLEHLIYFDYIILPKTNHSSSLKAIMNLTKFLKDSGIILNNSSDFKDLFLSNQYISFGFDDNCLYKITNMKQHNKIITGSIYKNGTELTEFLFCINNYDYIYFFVSLFVLCDNEYQSVEQVHIFFSKYIL